MHSEQLPEVCGQSNGSLSMFGWAASYRTLRRQAMRRALLARMLGRRRGLDELSDLPAPWSWPALANAIPIQIPANPAPWPEGNSAFRELLERAKHAHLGVATWHQTP